MIPRILLVALCCGVSLARPGAVLAQSGDGFLFERPDVQLGLHGGLADPRAQGELFTFVTDQLTLDGGDFNGVAAGGSFYLPLTDRLGVELSATYTGRGSGSEFRDWVDQDDVPIEQRTLFIRVPLIAGGRFYLVPPGRRVGSFAWIPSPVAPYVAGGVGAVWYRFRQKGDFVDFQDLDIFTDELTSDGWAPAAQAAAGAEFAVSTRLAVTAEAEYLWARADLGNDYIDFDAIDLDGLSATIGLAVRF